MILKYLQKTGELFQFVRVPIQHSSVVPQPTVWQWVKMGTGYAGIGDGLNNPQAEDVVNVGPIPCGIWAVSNPYTHPKLGPLCFMLTPLTYMGPRKAFDLHGDNSTPDPKDGSHGCPVFNHDVRQKIADAKVKYLEVEAQ